MKSYTLLISRSPDSVTTLSDIPLRYICLDYPNMCLFRTSDKVSAYVSKDSTLFIVIPFGLSKTTEKMFVTNMFRVWHKIEDYLKIDNRSDILSFTIVHESKLSVNRPTCSQIRFTKMMVPAIKDMMLDILENCFILEEKYDVRTINFKLKWALDSVV